MVHTEKTDYSSTITKWDGEDARVSFTTGFQFNPIKNLSFDCNWNILDAVFGNNLTSTFTEGDTETDVFWKNLNKLSKSTKGSVLKERVFCYVLFEALNYLGNTSFSQLKI